MTKHTQLSYFNCYKSRVVIKLFKQDYSLERYFSVIISMVTVRGHIFKLPVMEKALMSCFFQYSSGPNPLNSLLFHYA